jgi:hypothetical protein
MHPQAVARRQRCHGTDRQGLAIARNLRLNTRAIKIECWATIRVRQLHRAEQQETPT